MKKKIYFITTALAALSVLSLSSCLKDPRYVNFGQGGSVVNFPTGGLSHFGPDAITASTDTVVTQFAVELASPTVSSTPTTVTIAVDNSLIAGYNALGGAVTYSPMPTADFALSTTSVVIPAGQRSAAVTLTVYKSLLDPSLSFMLPIKIVSATGGATVSANFGVHYYHIIGNDFAGVYVWDYFRYNSNGVLPTPSGGSFLGGGGFISPITPSEFQMETGYNGQHVRYDITFTKTAPGVYTNWQVGFVPADVSGIWGAAGITVVDQPVFQVLDPANKRFDLQYMDFNGVADRYIIDSYHK